VRDFAYEPMPNSSNRSKAAHVFDLAPCFIATDGYMRKPYKNEGPLNPKDLSLPYRPKGLAHARGRSGRTFTPCQITALAQYNDRPDEQQYPFANMPPNQSIPSPSERVRLRRQSHSVLQPSSRYSG
jgi:hypothetical protein